MRQYFLLVTLLLLLTGNTSVLGQGEAMLLETIKLEHKPAGDILPLVEPLLPENAVIRGEGYKIILKTTAGNMPQIKQMIADLDAPLQQLQITVSLDPSVLQQDTTTATSLSDTTDQKSANQRAITASDTTQVYKTTGQQVAGGIQVIKVLPDRWSVIRSGQAIPVIQRTRNPDGTITESVHYRQVNQGLRLRPQLSDENITLTIQPFYEAASQTGEGQQLYYQPEKQTITRLGSWIGIDTNTGSQVQMDKKQLQQHRNPATPASLIYLKVDAAP